MHAKEKNQYLNDWIESAADAIKALENWQWAIREWQINAAASARIAERTEGDFEAAISTLTDEGLEGWLDGHSLDIDKLAALVKGEE